MKTWGPILMDWGVRIAGVLLAMWIAVRVANMAQRWVTKRLTDSGFDDTLGRFAGSMSRFGVLVLVGLSCMGVFGIETTSFAALIGAAGLAIGLAFQGTLSNVAGGVMLVSLRPFQAGDCVTAGGQTGVVEEIGLLTTELNLPNGTRIHVPNGQVVSGVVQNKSHHGYMQADVNVGVDYGADMDTVRSVLQKAADSVPNAVSDPAPVVVCVGLGASSVDWQVRVRCTVANYWGVLENATVITKKGARRGRYQHPVPDDRHQPQQGRLSRSGRRSRSSRYDGTQRCAGRPVFLLRVFHVMR